MAADGGCHAVTRARVAAFEQSYAYNRYGAFNPNGLIYALRSDIVVEGEGATDGPAIDASGLSNASLAGHVKLRKTKRARPLVLRVNKGDCLEVSFTNLVPRNEEGERAFIDPGTGDKIMLDAEEPATRLVSMHVNGLELAGDIRSDGAAVGRNPSGLVAPGETITYRWLASEEGGFFFYSMGDAVSGEGNGGQMGLGLFGSINVEPAGSKWYRSQITSNEMGFAKSPTPSRLGQPILSQAAYDGPSIAIRNAAGEIIHSDLNAVVAPATGDDCLHTSDGPEATCGAGFREFTAIFHDELTAEQAFAELDDETNPMHQLRDGMGINYGASGLGSMVMANRDTKGPGGTSRFALDTSRDCVECKLEEFFLTAWVVGDPAMIVDREPATRTAREALFQDDPSNVHHSYIGDPVRFRNIHAGPKETHIFHLHAHQWVRDPHSDQSVYLDSQTIGPGASYTYQISYGGAGNRNLEVGDSIFHCHLYPHFAQGMWAMWRAHDTFEDGSIGSYDPALPVGPTNQPRSRNLPDAELAQGSPSPAVVPIPGRALPPMPTREMPGYPFTIAGQIGHRPPQPPLDMARRTDPARPGAPTLADGGLQRHVIIGGERDTGLAAVEEKYFDAGPGRPYKNGLVRAAVTNAKRVKLRNADSRLFGLASRVTRANIRLLDPAGTAIERQAQQFHSGDATSFSGVPTVAIGTITHKPGEPASEWARNRGYPSCDVEGHCYNPASPDEGLLFKVNGSPPQPGAPFADPCPSGANGKAAVPERHYRAAYLQFDMTVNKAKWHDPQGRAIVLERDAASTLRGQRAPEPFFMRANSNECVIFEATNLIPSALNLDDFQVYSPTDAIGQHIHLVKFDVTSSDGSANGWNYEDSTLSADEVRERIIANNAYQRTIGGSQLLKPRVHPMFAAGGVLAGDVRGQCGSVEARWNEHPWCGAQSSVQRWWADPLRDRQGIDRTIRTVFTHDHLGPSSHQHHGFYAALVVEPTGSMWETIDGKTQLGGANAAGQPLKLRDDGGPTSWAANIIPPNASDPVYGDRREYNLAFADYAILYDAQNRPINPPNGIDHDLPVLGRKGPTPTPEGISTKDPGTQLLNYRNEPIPLRIGEASGDSKHPWRQSAGLAPACLKDRLDSFGQMIAGADTLVADAVRSNNRLPDAARTDLRRRMCDRGDIANSLSSRTHGDPFTHVLPAYQGDRVQIRLVQGAQEENHVFTMTGGKWLAQPGLIDSGWMGGQQIGISEHFEFNVQVTEPDPNNPLRKVDHLIASSASDNLWDGQWTLLRAYSPLSALGGASMRPPLRPLRSNPLMGMTPTTSFPTVAEVCNPATAVTVVAMLARDLISATNSVNARGVAYSAAALSATPGQSDHNGALNPAATITDPNGIIFFNAEDEAALRSGQRPLEPLVLRTPAGSCLDVTLVNRLPERLRDGPGEPASWSYNAMPPIVDGFNFNDFRSSSRVGLNPQMMFLNAITQDGANIGVNPDSTVAPLDCSKVLPGNPLATTNECLEQYNQQMAGSVAKRAELGWQLARGAKTFRWYAGDVSLGFDGTALSIKKPAGSTSTGTPVEFGVVALRDLADVIKHSSHGAIAALVVEPEHAEFTSDCARIAVGPQEATRPCQATATVTYPAHDDPTGPRSTFRELVVQYQDDLSLHINGAPMPNLGGDDDSEDTGQRAFSYRMEPMWARVGAPLTSEPGDLLRYDFSQALSSWRCRDGSATNPCANGQAAIVADPVTPMLVARAGEELRLRVTHPGGHPRNHGFSISGHGWLAEPFGHYMPDAYPSTWEGRSASSYSRYRYGATSGVGPGRNLNLLLGPAGGHYGVPGDYLYRSQDGLAFHSGQWGIVRVVATCPASGIAPDGAVCR